MSEPRHISRSYYLHDVSKSMNDTYNVIWPLCKIFPGRTRGEHALLICETIQQLSPNNIHRHFISFQGDSDENPEHPLSLDVIRQKYQDKSRPRYKSHIVQRVHNVLQTIQNDATSRPNSFSHLVIFSDGEDNKSTTALTELHQRTLADLRNLGISVVVINFGSTGLNFPHAHHYNSGDFPSGNMDREVRNMLQQTVLRPIHNGDRSNQLPHSLRNNNQSNIRTLNDVPLSVEERQYLHDQVYTCTN